MGSNPVWCTTYKKAPSASLGPFLLLACQKAHFSLQRSPAGQTQRQYLACLIAFRDRKIIFQCLCNVLTGVYMHRYARNNHFNKHI